MNIDKTGPKFKIQNLVKNQTIFLVLIFYQKINFQISEKKMVTVRFYQKPIIFSKKPIDFSRKTDQFFLKVMHAQL
jgi:hypothetical protein